MGPGIRNTSPHFSPPRPSGPEKRGLTTRSRICVKVISFFSTAFSRKRSGARDRLAILKKGNPAMNYFPCEGERQAIQAPRPEKNQKPSNILSNPLIGKGNIL